MKIKLKQVAYSLPQRVITNAMLVENFDNWSAEKIYTKLGVNTRHVVSANETAVDLAVRAAQLIPQCSSAESIIYCTQSPDYFLPSASCIIQSKIGCGSRTMCFDINQGCSGFVYGLGIVKSLISTGIVKSCLLITADTYSKYLAPDDISNRSLFGDGAAAAFFEAKEEGNSAIGEFVFGTDGGGFANLIVQNGAARSNFDGCPELYMNGPAIFDFVNKSVPSLVADVLNVNKITLDEVDYFIFHQANKYILEMLARKIGIAKEKFIINLASTGNTTSSSIPIAMSKLFEENIEDFRDKIIMCVGFGVGYSWGGTIIKL